VRGRVERFVEPSLLLMLAERPRHGYELLEEVESLAGEGEDTGADLGNLYRVLRGLESEGFVRSSWRPQLGAPPRRTYQITPAGRRLLAQWAEALARTQSVIGTFLERYEQNQKRGGRNADRTK
jgi:DNA-binding PadR family transcriptional regulator